MFCIPHSGRSALGCSPFWLESFGAQRRGGREVILLRCMRRLERNGARMCRRGRHRLVRTEATLPYSLCCCARPLLCCHRCRRRQQAAAVGARGCPVLDLEVVQRVVRGVLRLGPKAQGSGPEEGGPGEVGCAPGHGQGRPRSHAQHPRGGWAGGYASEFVALSSSEFLWTVSRVSHLISCVRTSVSAFGQRSKRRSVA